MCTTLYTSLGILYRKYTGWYSNDVNVCGHWKAELTQEFHKACTAIAGTLRGFRSLGTAYHTAAAAANAKNLKVTNLKKVK